MLFERLDGVVLRPASRADRFVAYIDACDENDRDGDNYREEPSPPVPSALVGTTRRTLCVREAMRFLRRYGRLADGISAVWAA